MNFTKEQIRYIIEHYETTKNSEIAQALGVSEEAVFKCANKIGCRKPKAYFAKFVCNEKMVTNRFQAGHTPHNKGVKGYVTTNERKIERMKATQFHKGNRPHNRKPVGSERTNKEGYFEVKTADPNKWELKHRVVWEKHNGAIPKGVNIQFVDGDRTNCDINNLYAITRTEQISTKNGIHAMPKELAELYILKGAVKRQLNKLKKQ